MTDGIRQSASIALLTPALVLAKLEILQLPLVKDAQGVKAKYIRLNTLLAGIEPILAAQRLILLQGSRRLAMRGGVVAIGVTTRLLHESGEWIENEVMIPVVGAQKNRDEKKEGGTIFHPADAQAGGVSLTYGRRYGVFALLSIAVDEDSDGAVLTQRRRTRARSIAEEISNQTAERTARLREGLETAKKAGGRSAGDRGAGAPASDAAGGP